MKLTNLLKSQQGSFFVVVSFVLSILFVLVMLVISISASELSVAQLNSDSNRAYYMAMSGLEMGIAGVEGYAEMESDGFAGGSGTEHDPYLIATASQLDNVRNVSESGTHIYFRQIADIDLSGYEEWEPILVDIGDKAFTYDGDGYIISNLKIDNRGVVETGLFQRIGADSDGVSDVLKNIGLVDVYIVDAYKEVGGLVGWSNNGVIDNCFVMGHVEGTEKVGLLVGINENATIKNSHAIGSVAGKGNGIGGLVGRNLFTGDNDTTSSSIINTYAHVAVTAENPQSTTGAIGVGGLVGENYINITGPGVAIIEKSFATGDVIAVGNKVGGLVGYNGAIDDAENPIIVDSFATGRVYAGGEDLGEGIGGLVGFNEGEINRTYATGIVSGNTSFGGIIGFDIGDGVENSYYLDPVTAVDPYTFGIEYATSAAIMKKSQTYVDMGWDITSSGGLNTSGNAFTWLISEDESFPFFNFADGDGTQGNPYIVETAMHLDNVRYYLGAHYKQTKDINLAAYSAGGGWQSIGTVDPGAPFTGVYDGNNKVIRNLVINATRDEFHTPDDLDEDLVLWLDADDKASIITSDGGVKAWRDRSGRGNHVYMGYDPLDEMPIYEGQAYRERGGVSFKPNPTTGAIQYLWRPTSFGAFEVSGEIFYDEHTFLRSDDSKKPLELGDEITVFVVAQSNYSTSEGAVFNAHGVPSSNRDPNGFLFHGNLNEDSLDFYLVAQDGAYVTAAGIDMEEILLGTEEDLNLARPNLFHMSTESNQYHYYGANSNTNTVLRNITRHSTGQAVNFYVGSDDLEDFRDGGLDGYVFEYIIYNRALASSQRRGVATYLMRKWGIDENPTGLFGYVDGSSGGAIRNVYLENVNVNGDERVGGLVGLLENGEIVNCYVDGKVTGLKQIGGLVGDSEFGSRVSHSYSRVKVDGNGDVGGLIGRAEGTAVSEGSFTGSILGTGENIGGIVGHSLSQSSINLGYASGDITGGGINVGGLVGLNEEANIENCYVQGTIYGRDDVGGLVGENDGGEVKTSYFAGELYYESTHGLLVGRHQVGDGRFEHCYALSFGGIEVLVGEGNIDGNGNEIRTDAQLKNKGEYHDDWDFEDGGAERGVWVMEDGIDFPHFYFDGGEGTANNPFRVRTAAQLDNVRNYLDNDGEAYYFRQIADINLTGFGRGFDDGKGWKPIGDDGDQFLGNFDGNLYRIANMYINRDDGFLGLFGVVGSATGTAIDMVSVVGAEVIGGESVSGAGIIAGKFTEGVTHSAINSSGTLRSKGGAIGGLVGVNEANITIAFSFADVEGDGSGVGAVGGLVGENIGRIDISYATGRVISGGNNVGGLVGKNLGAGEIENTYAKGRVTGRLDVGGLVGKNDGEIKYSYAIGDVLTDGVTQAGLTLDEGVSVSGVYLARTGYIGQGESKTEDQMKNEDDDGYSNWDFETIWTTDKADRDDDEKINEGYPYFRVHDYILIAKGTIAGRALGGGLELMEDSLDFSYIRNHSLEIEVRYSGSTGIYSIIADANYRNSQITLMRYVRFVGGEIEHLGTV